MAVMFLPASIGETGVLLNRLSSALRIPQDDSWMSAYHKDRKLGYVHTHIQMKGQGAQLVQQSRLRISVAGLTQSLESELTVELDERKYLKSLFFSMTAGPMAMSFSGLMHKDGLEIELQAGDKYSRRLIPMDEPPVLDLTVPFVLAQQDLYPGARFRVEVFDPKLMRNSISSVEVLGTEALSFEGKLVAVTHIRRNSTKGKFDSWFDQTGRVLKEEAEGGLMLLRQDKNQALSQAQDQGSFAGDSQNWLQMLVPQALESKEVR